jgi:hypothetical protein
MRALRPVLLALLLPAAAAAQDCPAANAPQQRYVNERHGFAFNHPRSFVLDPDSIPDSRDSARFWTADRRATAVVIGSRNSRQRSLADLMAEAEGDVVQNSRGEITYRRRRDNWFVISGHMVGRIFYQRTLLTADGDIATLWIEFPREMRACLDAAVTTMSLSFRERPIPSPSR